MKPQAHDREPDQEERGEMPRPPARADRPGPPGAPLAAHDRRDGGDVVRLESVAEPQQEAQTHVHQERRNHAREDTTRGLPLASLGLWDSPAPARVSILPGMTTLSDRQEPLVWESGPTTSRGPWETLVAIRDEIQGKPVAIWEGTLDSVRIGIGAVRRVETSGPGRFQSARDRLEGAGAFAIGGLSFAEEPGGGWP